MIKRKAEQLNTIITGSILTLLLLLVFRCGTAQTVNLNQFGIEEGLPQSSIYTMLQDKQGSIWVGTMNGISRYNGLNFENFGRKNGVAETRVTSSCVDSEGNIWFGHWSGGITKYDINTKEFAEVHPGKLLLSKTINSIFQDYRGVLWFATDGEGLLKNDKGTFTLLTKKDGLPSNTITSLTENKDNVLWIGTNNGIALYNNKFTPYSGNLPSSSIKCILEDSKGNMWIGTSDQGVFRINEKTKQVKQFDISSGLVSNNIRTIFEAQNGAVYIGTNSEGISKYVPQLEVADYTGSLFKTISTRQGLSNDHVFSIIQDREKNIWIGTQLNLNQYFDEQFEIFGENAGLKNSLVWSVIQDRNKIFWVGTEGGLVKFVPNIHDISKDQREKLTDKFPDSKNNTYLFTHKTGKEGEVLNTSSLYEDAKGNIWFTDFAKGAARLNPVTNEITRFTKANGLPVNDVYCFNGDKYGNIWFGTDKGGLVRFDILTEKFQTFTTKDGIGSNQIYSIYRDSKNRMWFASLAGDLTMQEPGKKFKTFSAKDGYPIKFTISITEDKKGNLWFGTFDQGIYKYDGKTFKNYSTKDGLSSDTPLLLVCDDNNNLWIGTGLGIDKFNLQDETFKHYEKDDGFLGVEINPNSAFKDNEGNLWFGSIVGLVKYNAKLEKNNSVEAITSIKDPRVFFQNVKIPTDHVFAWNQNHITFDFTGTSLTNPKRVKYRYFLDGVDKEWSPVVKENSVTYPDLDPGKYTFNVRSRNNDGVWNKEPVTFKFEISAPFWKTPWFYFVVLFVIFITSFTFIKLRERKLKQTNLLLEQKVVERTEIISKQKNEIEKKNNVIIDSIEYAKNIQQSILPTHEEISVHFKQYFILYKPKDIVSGDFYWMYESDDRILIAAADCTGHGVPGAFMSIMGYNLLNEIINEKENASPAEILDMLNRKILNSLKQHDTEASAKYGMDIALVSFDKNKSKLEFAGAHNPVLIYRGNECIQLKGDKLFVGSSIRENPTSFTNQFFDLQKGDTLYMYTDGYPDQIGGPENKKFYSISLRALLQSICHLDVQEQRKNLDDSITQWKGSKNQTDDMLIICVRV